MKSRHLRLTATVFCGLVAVSIALIYYVGRLGFTGYDAASLVEVALLSLFLIGCPQVLRLFRVDTRGKWFLSDAVLSLSGLLVVAMAGFLLSDHRKFIVPALCAVGALLFFWVVVQWVREGGVRRSLKTAVTLVVGAMLCGLSCFYPLVHEPWFREMLTAGLAHRDTMNHAAITSMIKTYGIPSTGLDGIPYHPYHNGADWILAQVSSLLGLPIIETVTMAFLVLFVPFFLSTFLCFIADVREKFHSDGNAEDAGTNLLFWVVLLVMFVGVLPGHNNYMGSQSYPPAMGLSFIFLSLCLHVAGRLRQDEHPFEWWNIALLVVVFPVLISLIGICKISLVWLLMWVCTYFVVRLRLYRRIVFLAAWLLMALSSFAIMKLVMYPADAQTGISPLYLMNWYPYWWPFFFVTEFIWSWIFIGLALYIRKINSITALSDAVRGRRVLDVEAAVVFCVVGAAPAMLLRISDASGLYFVDFQNWFSGALLLAYLPVVVGRDRSLHEEAGHPSDSAGRNVRRRVVMQVGAAILLAGVAVNGLASSFRTLVLGQVRTQVALRSDSETALAYTRGLTNMSISQFAREIIGWRDYLFATGDRARWNEANRVNRLTLQALQELYFMPKAEKRKTLLYIPKSNRLYWGFPATRCLVVPFIAPAVTGLAMIHGLPEPDCRAGGGRYGYEVYSASSKDEANSGDISDEQLCSQARERGFVNVVAFESDGGTPVVRRLHCEESEKRH